MSRWTQFSGATALACIFTASAAAADISGQDVWGDWRSYMEDFGYKITADEETSGDTLNIRNLKMAFDVPNDEGSFVMEMPEVSFTDKSDGTVSIDIPATSTVTIEGTAVEGEDFGATIEITTTGMTTIVSGDPDALTYNYTAASLAMALVNLEVEGDAPDEVDFNVTMKNLIGSSSMTVGDMRDAAQKFSTDEVTYEMRIIDTSEDANVVATGSVDGMTFEGTGAIPTDYDVDDPAALFKSGFAFEGTFTQGPSQMQLSAISEEQPFSLESSSGGGALEMALGEAGLAYAGVSTDIAVSVAGSDIPLPVSFNMAEASFDLLMPLMASEDEQDFAFGMTLAGLAVPDLLWNMFDPGSVLPRDPATVSFDLEGTTRLFKDLMDPTLEQSDEFPGELNSLTLKDLVVELGGAELTGEGEFTFDNTDTESFDGMPRPTGAADLRLLGGNGLLDKLIQMGFVSEQDAMGARMMMGLFTVPGTAEDELNSRIEVNEDGHVLANGQRIK